MKTRAAVLWEVGQEWSIEEVELDPLRPGEILVETKAAGMCHSDEHLVTGDITAPPETIEQFGRGLLPMIGGHEGAGVVVEVGEGVTSVAPGDHVAASFIPSCGGCRYCLTGRHNLCDMGAFLFAAGMMPDMVDRHHTREKDVWAFCKLGTFAEHMMVTENSIIKIDKDYPLTVAAIVSCGVATGWGAAVNRAEVKPGDTVVVIGVGGLGINAVQGARHAGAAQIIAVDPVEFKRENAQKFGATHTAVSMEEALPLVTDLTAGQMADSAIITTGEGKGEYLQPAMSLVGKDSTVVFTSIAPMTQMEAQVSLFELAMFNKQIRGTIFGSQNPRIAIPKLLDLYRKGHLKLDELITRTYTLDQINEGYQDMRDGKNIRGVITFD
jgi:S-(hydroxymethyl)glutathione dehydrogenase/alcohol dehydrogenase